MNIPFKATLMLAVLAFPQREIRVNVSLVNVGVRVTDSRGRDVRGLKAEDFVLFQDGTPQSIAAFSSDPQPVTMGIVFDRSSSMEANNKIDRAKDAAIALVKGAREGSEYYYIEFNEKVRIAMDFTAERQSLITAIGQTLPDGSTSLYDAVLEGVATASRARLPRQVLIVISDGADQHSTHELEEVIDIVRESRIQIYTIGYFSKEEDQISRAAGKTISLSNGAQVDNPRIALQQIAEQSGALSFFPRSDAELDRAVSRIVEDLDTQYTLGFYPPDSGSEGGYHRIQVTIKGDRYNIRARPGYGVRSFSAGNVPPKASMPQTFGRVVQTREGKRTFRDDFGDARSGWPRRDTSDYFNNGYRLKGDDVVVTAGPELGNFRASVKVAMDEVLPINDQLPRVGARVPTPGNSLSPVGAGLLFRQTEKTYYAFVLYPPTALQGGFAIVTHQDASGRVSEIARWSVLNRPSRERLLEVQCTASVCDFREGGATLGRLNSVKVDAGRIGMVLQGKGTAVFDDLVVEER